jgi:competence protein ComEC
VDFGETSFLFNGDMEASMEKIILASGLDLNVDVMTMGHHGSETSSSSAYFKAASPTYAAISCGEDNSYGHPHKSTIQKLKKSDVLYRRTDINGTISFLTNGKTIDYSTEK